MEFETGETVVWKGKPAFHIRYPLLAALFFALIFVINLGPIGQAIGALSVILWILFMLITMVSLSLDARTKYYITNSRIITRRASMLVPELSTARVEQTRLGKIRNTGNVYFNSKDGRWIVFKHVKEPEQIRQSALNLVASPTNTPTILICNYCGARLAVGTTKCSTCGADI